MQVPAQRRRYWQEQQQQQKQHLAEEHTMQGQQPKLNLDGFTAEMSSWQGATHAAKVLEVASSHMSQTEATAACILLLLLLTVSGSTAQTASTHKMSCSFHNTA